MPAQDLKAGVGHAAAAGSAADKRDEISGSVTNQRQRFGKGGYDQFAPGIGDGVVEKYGPGLVPRFDPFLAQFLSGDDFGDAGVHPEMNALMKMAVNAHAGVFG
jgi:hypothetical protein